MTDAGTSGDLYGHRKVVTRLEHLSQVKKKNLSPFAILESSQV